MKKVLSILLFAVLLCTLLPKTALFAHGEVIGGSCGAPGYDLRWEFDPETGELRISGTGSMEDYNNYSVNAPWYPYEYTSVYISAGVTSVGVRAFTDSGVTKVFLPEGLRELGRYCFSDCTSLESIELPSTVNTMGDSCFSGCTALESIKLPGSIERMWGYCFSGCTSLTEVVLEDGIGKVGKAAFSRCSSIKEITIPDSVTIIGDYAFYQCDSLASVKFGANVKQIGGCAFSECSALTEVKIPDHAACEIRGAAFEKCLSLERVETGNGATVIEERAFSGCTKLESVVIGESVTRIERFAFEQCKALRAITIPDSVTELGADAFDQCSSLKTASIGDGVPSIEGGTFSGCFALSEVEIGSSVSSIEVSAFRDCYALRYIRIPAPVTSIGYIAFKNCNSLKRIEVLNPHCDIDSFTEFTLGAPTYTTVYAREGSTAQTYAEQFGYQFVPLEEDFCVNGHSWNNGIVTLEATCTAAGEKTHTCIFCGETMTEEIPALGHAFGDWTQLRAATCTENGVESRFCPHCETSEERDTPALGHSFSYGVCSSCGEKDPDYPESKFTDVASGVYYEAPVNWAVENQITVGTSETTFSPDDTCTRAQVVTFLWRAKGSPTPESDSNPFEDVKSDDYYYDAVLWAVENKITVGTGETTFSPDKGCSRAEVVTFLWRYENEPGASPVNPFYDIEGSEYYYKAVLWAAENGITVGTAPGYFSPDDTCTRAQIVTFLYRDLAQPSISNE